MTEPSLQTEPGIVVRIVNDGFGYVLLDRTKRTLSFDASVVVPLGANASLSAHNVAAGSEVNVIWDECAEVIHGISTNAASAQFLRSPIDDVEFAKPALPTDFLRQFELDPASNGIGKQVLSRAIPPKTRAFGKVLDTGRLLPGDLLLSRDVVPDTISIAISEVQERGGYENGHARWTHAAMYVGDGQHIVEATFDSLASGGSVRLSSLDDYCTGDYFLRLRRPLAVSTDIARWRLCVRAMSRLHQDYNFAEAIRMWFRVMISKKGFYDDPRRGPLSKAALCSTLYADSYNEATRRSLGEVGGVCVPAWLSGSDEFSDIQCNWLHIE